MSGCLGGCGGNKKGGGADIGVGDDTTGRVSRRQGGVPQYWKVD